MKVSDLLDAKGRSVVTVPPSLPLENAAQLMIQHDIGSVVVADEPDVLGILTERDILRLVAKRTRRTSDLTVSEVMTKDVLVGLPSDSLEYVRGIMTQNRIRHLPIVEGMWLDGILSIRDILKAVHKEVTVENRFMRDYIQGKTY
jgi:CBS domain-containing protein